MPSEAQDSLDLFEVRLIAHGHVAARLPHGIDHLRLVYHVPLAEGDQVFEVVGEELAADVYAVPSAIVPLPCGGKVAYRLTCSHCTCASLMGMMCEYE